jgi:rhamnogalacturonyl hydrolase YesR
MPRFPVVVLLVLLSVPSLAAPKRRAVRAPSALTRESITAMATKVADRATWTFHPRLHWENAVFFDGLVLLGEQLELQQPGSGQRFLDRAASVILESDDDIANVHWGDGTAFGQAAMDLYRVLPPSDPRRPALLATLAGPMRFAEHAIRATPADAAPRDPWWITGGYGARFWQDDLYMVVPWLAARGRESELARNLTYEWIEAYVHEHRPEGSAVASLPTRGELLLWNDEHALFQHQPESRWSTEFFWARGNGWTLVALARAAEALDAPYTGGRYEQVIGAEELREMLQLSAASLLDRRSPDGGWGSYLSRPEECPVAETSGTALLTFFLARGINQGWLDREVYTPVVLRAFGLLMRRVDASGSVSGIQPPDIGPNCGKIASPHVTINVNYGPGAVLLAASEVLKLVQ